jgi:hypothetical protein
MLIDTSLSDEAIAEVIFRVAAEISMLTGRAGKPPSVTCPISAGKFAPARARRFLSG